MQNCSQCPNPWSLERNPMFLAPGFLLTLQEPSLPFLELALALAPTSPLVFSVHFPLFCWAHSGRRRPQTR